MDTLITHFVADFETTVNPDDCRVWLWALTPIQPGTTIYGLTIDEFVGTIERMHSHIYFHNLAFDGMFLLDYLLREGYRHTEDKGVRGEFESLISKQGKFYSIKVYWRKGGTTEFRDSYKKIPLSVGTMAKAFNLELSKGTIDYEADRPIGYEPTPHEIEYVCHDVEIVAQAMAEVLNAGATKLTVGADSLAEYRRIMTPKRFKRLFPVLPDDVDKGVRTAYRGGFTYVNPKFQGKELGGGIVFDVNSLYPSVMYNTLLPYGTPQWCDGLPELCDGYSLFIASITFTAKLKPGHIPCIQIKGSRFFMATEYLTEISEPVTLSCTNVDLALWNEHYDLVIYAYNGGYRFHGAYGMFTQYIDKWSEIKETSIGGKRVIAKLHLNSLYGKFATNPDVTGKIPVLEDNRVKLILGDPQTREPVYTAVGVFITSYARNITVRAAQQNFDRFIYADTDSLHLLGTELPDIDIHPTRMGAWKQESVFTRAVFVRSKCYGETINGTDIVHIAGLPAHVAKSVTLSDMMTGATYKGKLVPKRVPGGVVLTDVGFRLTPATVVV